ncbi:hypothetical protein PAXINDRAFT_103782 [Paxillus involutus ATCC 200175]|uniref:TATA-binding protein interacting (TIP20) domain-containing protein n=1 Tax=Paxillus involutus ATCC 200175 TaxID=664439 RepID=A0A0C9TDW8_PAXIN|nr:hypothetical protein PAXINDRAFT_103782 [Paxillus involutus ATCC 200175]
MQSISNLISLAAGGSSSSISLKEIHEAVVRYNCAKYLEPLSILLPLLSCHCDGAMDLIRDCGLSSSPKEVLIVVQEAIEQLQSHGNDEEDETEDPDPDIVHRVIGIVSLCSPAISRSRLRKTTALKLCSPVLDHMCSLISSASPRATKDEGRALITEVARLVKALGDWAPTVAIASDLVQIKVLLRELLDTTVMGCASSIQANLAARAVESRFPRFSFKSAAKEGWQEGEKAMLNVQVALTVLSDSSRANVRETNSLSDLIYLAHSTPPAPFSPSALPDLHRLLVQALQMNLFLDESLFLLFRILTQEGTDVPPDVATSLCEILAALASTHLDPFVRQLSLRMLSLTLSRLPPPPRLEILLKLTTDQDFPQMRGPAIGLVKEAVLEALALPAPSARLNPFASPELLRVFGGVLFRPNPPEFFSERKTREELERSLELLRIVDCLSFYYVLLQRDRENKTEVRSVGNVRSVQSSFLRPLRQFLTEHTTGQEQPLMAILSLQVGLDRIDDALRTLDLTTPGHKVEF